MKIRLSKILIITLVITFLSNVIAINRATAVEDNIIEKAKLFASTKADLVSKKARDFKSEEQFIDFLRTEVSDMVAVNYMSLWVLGANRNSFSKNQIDSFITIFTKNVTWFYGKIIYVNKYKVFKLSKVFSNAPNTATIEFNVNLDKNSLLVDWQVRNSIKENKLLITDFVVNGISFLQAKRAEYNALFQSCGKDPEKFLALLNSQGV